MATKKRLRCAVTDCKFKHGQKQSLHRLPTDPVIQNQWLQFIFSTRSSAQVSKCAVVCSGHFSASNIINHMEYNAGFASKVRLKPGAVPSIREPTTNVWSQCEAEPGSEGEEDVDRVPHAVVETCLLTSLKWLEQQPEATPRQLQLLRELHTLAVRKRERPVRAPVNRRAVYAGGNPHRTRRKQGELSGGALGTAPSAAPEHNLVEHLIKVEVDDKNLPLGTFLCPDPIGAVTLSEEHVTQGSELEDFNCVKSRSDRLKCEHAEIQSVII